MTDATDALLAGQYEAYPYPARDPRDEAKRLIIGSPSHLREVDYWALGGRRPPDRPLRALIAGGGTGDALVMLATQMVREQRPGRVTYLDRSAAAARIARARATGRGLDNVDWVEGSLLELPRLGIGPFDYIDCVGVLHHLPDPAEGLMALLSVLAPGGGMGLMVYAPHGRTGVYMAQDALRLLAPVDEPPAARLDVARRVMRHLPPGAWLRQNRSVTDHLAGGDAGLVDLLLNPRDRAFNIGAFLALLDQAGLAATCLLEPLRYDPDVYLPDPKLRARIAGLDRRSRAMLAEALSGTMSTHVVYCTRTSEPPDFVDPGDLDAVPVAREGTGQDLARTIRPDGTVLFSCEAVTVPVPLPRAAASLLRAVDGRALADMPDRVARGWPETCRAMMAMNRLTLSGGAKIDRPCATSGRRSP